MKNLRGFACSALLFCALACVAEGAPQDAGNTDGGLEQIEDGVMAADGGGGPAEGEHSRGGGWRDAGQGPRGGDSGKDSPADASDAGNPDAAAPEDPCAEDNGGCDALTSCMVVEGEVVCGDCPAGYTGSGADGCADVDECAQGSAQCSALASCENQAGGYRCGSCPAGYDDEKGDGSSCVDIDECEVDNGGCDPLTECENQEGGRSCGQCPEGFVSEDMTGATPCLLDDPSLAGLSVETDQGPAELSPEFDPDTTEYTLESDMPLSAEELTLTATLSGRAQGRATITVAGTPVDEQSLAGTVPLLLGPSTIEVVVTTETGNTRTYSVTARRFRDFRTYVKASNTGQQDAFGVAIALSGDGNTLAVGAPQEDSRGGNPSTSDDDLTGAGAVYVFVRIGDDWVQQAFLKAANRNTSDNFGVALSLSADGSLLAVGSRGDAGCQPGVRPVSQAEGNDCPGVGAVHVYSRTGSAWNADYLIKPPTIPIDPSPFAFGNAVALSGDGETLLVGAPLMPSDDGIGAAYLYDRATSWALRVELLAGAADCGGCPFGVSVAVSDNGQTLAVARHDETVFLYEREGRTVGTPRELLTGSSGQALLPPVVALSGDGLTLAVGSPSDASSARGIFHDPDSAAAGASAPQSGAVHLFERQGNDWHRAAYIKAPNAGEGDGFGLHTGLSDDGSVLAVAASAESGSRAGVSPAPGGGDDAMQGAGAVYIYRRSSGDWREDEYVKAPLPEPSDFFGTAVALSGDGNALAVSAIGEDSEARGPYSASEAAAAQNNNGAISSGAVYVYH